MNKLKGHAEGLMERAEEYREEAKRPAVEPDKVQYVAQYLERFAQGEKATA